MRKGRSYELIEWFENEDKADKKNEDKADNSTIKKIKQCNKIKLNSAIKKAEQYNKISKQDKE